MEMGQHAKRLMNISIKYYNMPRRIYIILKEDIVYYPPIISLIKILLNLQLKVIHIGVYSDIIERKKLEEKGLEYVQTLPYNGEASTVSKLRQQLLFRKFVTQYLKSQHLTRNDFLWIVQIETLYLLHNLVYRYNTIVHLLEFINPRPNIKYRFISPSLNVKNTLRHAKKIVCCEYNRAHIIKGMFDLDVLPDVLPNKTYDSSESNDDCPENIRELADTLSLKCKDKFVILYQGYINNKERRLDDFCEAMNSLSDEFVLIIMGNLLGKNANEYNCMINKYKSEKIIFLPFIKPPFHLLITKIAQIGILTYFPNSDSLRSILNPLYCAPNKIFEYSRFGIPMIANDIPGLHYIFKEHHCGICIDYPITANKIRDTILNIRMDYMTFSEGSLSYYNSIDLIKAVKNIISD